MENISIAGARLKNFREINGITQKKLAELLGVSIRQIVNIENSDTIKPIFADLISSKYNVNKQWLLTGQGEMFASSSNKSFNFHNSQDFVGNVESGGIGIQNSSNTQVNPLHKEICELLQWANEPYLKKIRDELQKMKALLKEFTSG